MNDNKQRWMINGMAALSAGFISAKLIARKGKEDTEVDKENQYVASNKLEQVETSLRTPTHYEKYVKPIIDSVLSFSGLVLLSPLYFFISLAIVIDDPGPVLFTQKRVGKDKHFFILHKFRSMKMSTPHDVPTHQLSDPDFYITRVGKFLRKTSLDELPQIWDIFRGRMSIIGPRPALWNQADLVAERDKYHANDVLPGLSGLAQISGRDELEIVDKARVDGEYVQNISFFMDFKCFIGTISSVLKSDGIVEGGTGKLNKCTNEYPLRDEVPKTDPKVEWGYEKSFHIDLSKHKYVLVTGAGSYIGESFKQYAGEYYSDNFSVDTLDMKNESWRNYDFRPYDCVFHVAGIAHADVGNIEEAEKELYYKVNTDLAIEVARKSKEAGVKQFIFMSSMIVYGGKDYIDAHTVPHPENFYGDSKWQADQGVRRFADDNFKVAVLRPPMIYGKGSKGNYPVLAKLAKKLPVFPYVQNKRSMLYIENLCEFICKLMLSAEGGVYIPQNGEYGNTSELVKTISEISGRKVIVTKLLTPAVTLGSYIPGKVSRIIKKAFGSSVYAQELSVYNGLNYRKMNIKQSIIETEENNKYKKKVEDVTFIILTKNEEINLPDCLKSIEGFAKRVVVIDSGSSDKTCDIAKKMGAEVMMHPFENYAKQFNWALDHANITTRWTFRLDADERLTPRLCNELSRLMQVHKNDEINGISMEAWLYFLGKRIEHGAHNKRKLMLFKTGIGRIEDRKMDEHTIFLSGESVFCKERFIHYDFKDMTHWIHKMNWYATREMQDYYDYINGKNVENLKDTVILTTRKKKFGIYYKAPIFIRAWLLFIYYYIFRGGFLDGKEGFVFCYMYHRWYRTLVDAKILEQSIYKRPFEKTGDLK